MDECFRHNNKTVYQCFISNFDYQSILICYYCWSECWSNYLNVLYLLHIYVSFYIFNFRRVTKIEIYLRNIINDFLCCTHIAQQFWNQWRIKSLNRSLLCSRFWSFSTIYDFNFNNSSKIFYLELLVLMLTIYY